MTKDSKRMLRAISYNKAPESKIRVLLIEDNAADAMYFGELLSFDRENPFDVVHVPSLAEALRVLSSETMNVLLLDLTLPENAELAALKLLREKFPETPVVVSARVEDPAMAREALSNGAQDYLYKGHVDTQTLSRALRYAIGRKEIERALRRNQEALLQTQKMEAVGRLAGGVAHDFNNLLTTILGLSRLMVDELEPSNPLRADVEEIIRCGEQATKLTQQLLAMGRKQMTQRRSIDIKSFLTKREILLQSTLGDRITLTMNLQIDAGVAEADEQLLEQMMINLAENAREAMPFGGELHIELEKKSLDDEAGRHAGGLPAGEYLMIAVRDTGCGMSDEVTRRAFEPFFTTKEKYKGSGLGLSTVYGIVKQLNGSVLLQSKLNHGSTVTVYLPLVFSTFVEPKATTQELMPRGTETILLVEDDDGVKSLTTRILEGLGYRVFGARDVNEAFHYVDQNSEPIHLVLTDVIMPHCNGPSFVHRLKAVREGFKVLYMSGFTDEVVIHHGAMSPEGCFLQKPFSREALAQKVRIALDSEGI